MEVFRLGTEYLSNVDIKNITFKSEVEDEQCLARIWGDGSFGNERCNRFIKNNCMCKKHYEASLRMNGKWWLGLITEDRPEDPIHPISGKHKWSKDKDGNDYIVDVEVVKEVVKEVKVKRPRGRPKGSKNKKQ